jgi:NitT/TauT family transport system ATP-binding protein
MIWREKATTNGKDGAVVTTDGTARSGVVSGGVASDPRQKSTGGNAGGPPKLEVDDVAIGYVSKRRGSFFEAVRSLSFTVPDESLVALVGPSGCGKSTFLRSVCGLLGYHRGRLLIDGSVVDGPRSDCSLVFQSPALLPWRTVERNVGYGLELRGLPKSEVKERVGDMLELVGLSSFASHYPHQLSGGMQQRANLARALANQPVLLLMDEPFSALDPQTRDRLGDELLRIRELTKQTVLLVTHQVDEAVLLADKCVVLSRGPGSVVAGDFDVQLDRGSTIEETRHDPRYGQNVRELRELLAEASAEDEDARR